MLAPLHTLVAAVILAIVNAAFPPSLRLSHPVSLNRIIDINSTCDFNAFNITVSMDQPFKGLLFAKDFSQECRSFGIITNALTLNLPTSGCGVRLSSDPNDDIMYYSVTVVVQQDRHLRQITDQERIVQCYVEDRIFQVKSKSLEEIIKGDIDDSNHRKGRMSGGGWSREEDVTSTENGKVLAEALTAARAWMEIVPVKDNGNPGTLQVGEPTFLMVKSTLPAGIGWRVVDCTAHDGLGDSSQKLLDENGCPLDELLLPPLFKRPARPINFMKHQEAVTKFAAFKFPDRDRLHLNCGLQLCRGSCDKIDCSAYNDTSISENRLPRTLSKGQQGEILDRFEVFNSVEVKAPGIELEEDFRNFERVDHDDDLVSPFGNIPGDRTFCVSPDKMALTFCLLGLIFLFAIIVAAWSLLRARRTGANLPYYTRSLFSSTSGSGFGGSKLLLHESPCLGHSSRSLHSYGRIL